MALANMVHLKMLHTARIIILRLRMNDVGGGFGFGRFDTSGILADRATAGTTGGATRRTATATRDRKLVFVGFAKIQYSLISVGRGVVNFSSVTIDGNVFKLLGTISSINSFDGSLVFSDIDFVGAALMATATLEEVSFVEGVALFLKATAVAIGVIIVRNRTTIGVIYFFAGEI